MSHYIEYEVEEGLTLLVEAPERLKPRGVRAGVGDNVVEKADKKLGDSLEGVKKSMLTVKKKLEDLRADEVEVTFGLTTTGKVGNFAIAEVGVEANFTVKLTWKNPAEGRPTPPI